jgi:hypothetical protein
LRLLFSSDTVNLFVALLHVPSFCRAHMLAPFPLDELFEIYSLLEQLEATALVSTASQVIGEKANERPLRVLAFASSIGEEGDLELGRCAIRGLASREGAKLAGGGWSREDTKVSRAWSTLVLVEQRADKPRTYRSPGCSSYFG